MRVPTAEVSQRSPHTVADSGDEVGTCECRPKMRAALSAHGGGDEAVTCVSRPKKRAPLSAQGGGGEADTCVCRLQKRERREARTPQKRERREALPAQDGGASETRRRTHACNATCAARRSAQRSP